MVSASPRAVRKALPAVCVRTRNGRNRMRTDGNRMDARTIPNRGTPEQEALRWLFSGNVDKRPARELPEVPKGRGLSDVGRKA